MDKGTEKTAPNFWEVAMTLGYLHGAINRPEVEQMMLSQGVSMETFHKLSTALDNAFAEIRYNKK